MSRVQCNRCGFAAESTGECVDVLIRAGVKRDDALKILNGGSNAALLDINMDAEHLTARGFNLESSLS